MSTNQELRIPRNDSIVKTSRIRRVSSFRSWQKRKSWRIEFRTEKIRRNEKMFEQIVAKDGTKLPKTENNK